MLCCLHVTCGISYEGRADEALLGVCNKQLLYLFLLKLCKQSSVQSIFWAAHALHAACICPNSGPRLAIYEGAIKACQEVVVVCINFGEARYSPEEQRKHL